MDNAPRPRVGLLGCPVHGQKRHSLVPVGLFQPQISYGYLEKTWLVQAEESQQLSSLANCRFHSWEACEHSAPPKEFQH